MSLPCGAGGWSVVLIVAFPGHIHLRFGLRFLTGTPLVLTESIHFGHKICSAKSYR